MFPFSYRNPRDPGLFYLLDLFERRADAGKVSKDPDPGPGQRQVVTDTESKMSSSIGRLRGDQKAAPAYGDPSVWWYGYDRLPGLMLFSGYNPIATTNIALIGWDGNQTTDVNQNSFFFSSAGGIATYEATVLGPVTKLYNPGAGLDYIAYGLMVALRAAGAYYFVIGGDRNHWSLLRRTLAGVNATVYPGVNFHTGQASIDPMVIPQTRWLPAPIVSNGFTGAISPSDGFGHPEGITGGLGAGGGGINMSEDVGTWTLSGGVAVRASALGAGAEAVMVAEAGTPGQYVCAKTWYGASPMKAGIIARYTDINNYIYVYVFDNGAGNRITMRKVVAGVDSEMIAVAALAGYVAGGKLEMTCYNDKVQMYYEGARYGTEQTITDAVLMTGTKAGLWTDEASVNVLFDDLVVLATGSEGQYDWLDRFTGRPGNFVDTFSRANNALMNLAESGHLWTPFGSAPLIDTQRMVIPAVNGLGFGLVDFHKTPHTMAANISFAGGGGGPASGVCYLLSSYSFMDRDDNCVELVVTNATWLVRVTVATVPTTILNGAKALAATDPHHISMTIEGNTATITVPGEVHQVTDTRIGQLAGKHCAYALRNTAIVADYAPRFDAVEAYFAL